VRRIAMGSRASDDRSGGRQRQVLIVEVAAERGHCRFILLLARRIWVSFIATGRGPARWEIGSALSESKGGDHEVSILMTTVVADGRWCGWQPGAKVSMMSMRPPQHGQGCELVATSSVPPQLPGLSCGFSSTASS
jgi:hypothetical protein